MAYEFTESQKADVRRFMGYSPKGTDSNTNMSGLLFNESGALEYRLDKLTEDEGLPRGFCRRWPESAN